MQRDRVHDALITLKWRKIEKRLARKLDDLHYGEFLQIRVPGYHDMRFLRLGNAGEIAGVCMMAYTDHDGTHCPEDGVKDDMNPDFAEELVSALKHEGASPQDFGMSLVSEELPDDFSPKLRLRVTLFFLSLLGILATLLTAAGCLGLIELPLEQQTLAPLFWLSLASWIISTFIVSDLCRCPHCASVINHTGSARDEKELVDRQSYQYQATGYEKVYSKSRNYDASGRFSGTSTTTTSVPYSYTATRVTDTYWQILGCKACRLRWVEVSSHSYG